MGWARRAEDGAGRSHAWTRRVRAVAEVDNVAPLRRPGISACAVCSSFRCASSSPVLAPRPRAVRPLRLASSPVVSEGAPRGGVVESGAASMEEVARAMSSTVETARLVAGATSLRASRLGFSGAPSRVAALIVERAVQLVGVKQLGRVDRSVPDDCSGFVRLAYLKAGIDLVNHGFLDGENAVTAIFRRAQGRGAVHNRRPRPGGPRLLP